MAELFNKQAADAAIDKIIEFQDKKEVFAGPVNKFRPVQDYVVLYRPKFDKMTKSGIMKSDGTIKAELDALPKAFEVVAVGEKIDKSIVDVGKFVLVSRSESNPNIQSDRPEFDIALVRMYDIVGVFDK